MAKVGRPKYEITPAMMEEIEDLGGKGFTKRDIAACLGMHYDTLNERCKENPEIAEAIKRGKLKARRKLTGKLYEVAMSGNVSALIFIHKTQFEGWNDKRLIEVTGKDGQPFQYGEITKEMAEKYEKLLNRKEAKKNEHRDKSK